MKLGQAAAFSLIAVFAFACSGMKGASNPRGAFRSPGAPSESGLDQLDASGPDQRTSEELRLSLLDRPLCTVSEVGLYCSEVRSLEALASRPERAREGSDRAERLTTEWPARYEGWLLRGRFERGDDGFAFGEGGESSRIAIRSFERAAELALSEPVVRLELARTRLMLGDAAQALPLLRELAINYGDDAEVIGSLGVSFLSLGQVGEARTAFERAVRLDKKSAERWVALGTACLLQGDLGASERAFRQAIHLNPSLTKAHGDLGALLLLQGRLEEGIGHLKRALDAHPKSSTYLSNLAYGRYLQGSPEALDLARAAVVADPSLVSARLTLALILAAGGDVDAASSEIGVAEGLAPDDPRVQTARSDLEELRGARP